MTFEALIFAPVLCLQQVVNRRSRYSEGQNMMQQPALDPAPCVDAVIVRAAIHPAIGVARIGDSVNEFFIGPEVVDPAPEPPEYYRDAAGALKRQAARFRIYGYNAEFRSIRVRHR
jgi:hypothetical protein